MLGKTLGLAVLFCLFAVGCPLLAGAAGPDGFANVLWGASKSQVDQAMAMLDLEGLRQRPATALSGGEQARVLMARAVAQATPVLLADEPAAGLDPAHQIHLMMVLRQLAGQGRCVLVSLHDLALAGRWCDRLLVLKDGALVADGAPAAVLTAATIRAAFGVEAAFTADGAVLAPVALAGRSA